MSEKLKALVTPEMVQQASDCWSGYGPGTYAQHMAEVINRKLAALASPSPAPSEPLREALERALHMKQHGAANEYWDEWEQQACAALDSTKASELAAPARHGVREATDRDEQPEEWCAGYEAGIAQEREKHTDPMKWLESAFSTYKVMIRALYEHRLKKGRDWCEQQSCWPESQYWQGYHKALADQQAKVAPWEAAAKEQADGQ